MGVAANQVSRLRISKLTAGESFSPRIQYAALRLSNVNPPEQTEIVADRRQTAVGGLAVVNGKGAAAAVLPSPRY